MLDTMIYTDILFTVGGSVLIFSVLTGSDKEEFVENIK